MLLYVSLCTVLPSMRDGVVVCDIGVLHIICTYLYSLHIPH